MGFALRGRLFGDVACLRLVFGSLRVCCLVYLVALVLVLGIAFGFALVLGLGCFAWICCCGGFTVILMRVLRLILWVGVEFVLCGLVQYSFLGLVVGCLFARGCSAWAWRCELWACWVCG